MVRIGSTAGVVDEVATLGGAGVALIVGALGSITGATRATVVAVEGVEVSSVVLRVAVIGSAGN